MGRKARSEDLNSAGRKEMGEVDRVDICRFEPEKWFLCDGTNQTAIVSVK
jgi:hypothetical protein